VQHPAVRGLPVADGEHDVVTLVALNPLEVLHEEGLGPVLVEEGQHVGRGLRQGAANRLLDPGRVDDAQGDDAERAVRTGAGVLEDQLDDPVDLGGRALEGRDVQADSTRKPRAYMFDAEVFDALRARNIALCVADSEKLHSPVEITASYGYFRLRDEGYQQADIERWARTIRELGGVSDVFVYFKHEEQGLGPDFARRLMNAMGITT